jgi:hypothetical protein
VQLVGYLNGGFAPWAPQAWATAARSGDQVQLCSHARWLLASLTSGIVDVLYTWHPAFPAGPSSAATIEERARALHEALQDLPPEADASVCSAFVQSSQQGLCLAVNLAHLHTVHRLCVALPACHPWHAGHCADMRWCSIATTGQ